MEAGSCYIRSMASSDLLRVFAALEAARVRYLVVGGVAVVLHGHLRVTADLDVVVQLTSENALAAIRALDTLGFRPRAPVPAEQFADAQIRERWIEDKGLTVFSLWSPSLPGTEVDLFVREPFEFDPTHERATFVQLEGVTVPVLSLPDLIALKRAAGRPKDLQDADALEAILAEDADE
jgi:hypothetical protein